MHSVLLRGGGEGGVSSPAYTLQRGRGMPAPGLAHAARSGQGQQPNVRSAAEVNERRDLSLTTNERREWNGEPRRMGSACGTDHGCANRSEDPGAPIITARARTVNDWHEQDCWQFNVSQNGPTIACGCDLSPTVLGDQERTDDRDLRPCSRLAPLSILGLSRRTRRQTASASDSQDVGGSSRPKGAQGDGRGRHASRDGTGNDPARLRPIGDGRRAGRRHGIARGGAGRGARGGAGR